MIVSQRPSASAPLRIARKISPSDQRFNGPAGVRLEGTNDPTGIGTLLPMSRPPVSSPSDQRFNGPAGVRLEGTNDPTGIGTLLPMSRPPVSSPSDQRFNGPAGVRLEGTNDPTGIGTLLPMSRPPVRWHALQKPSTSALPRISTYPEG